MTAEEKTSLSRFLNLTGDYLKGGYALSQEDHAFTDDAQAERTQPVETGTQAEPAHLSGDLSSLPLAYQVDEDEEGETIPNIADLAAAIHSCTACGLSATRTHTVPGEGVSRPLVMVIGEGPGADEDAAGRPFVGKAGQLLDRMLASIGLFRDKNCYIANMVKCRPPENRDPTPGEIAACFPFLEQQIALLRPRVILCAGRVAAQNLLKTSRGIHALRGTFAEYKSESENVFTHVSPPFGDIIPVLCTFHPSAILRDESNKRPAWEDLKLLRSKLDSLVGDT